MKYEGAKELELLRILSESTSANGVFFARWGEIGRQNYSAGFIESIVDAPTLSPKNEYHLREMEGAGLVRELESWATREGLHFELTRAGSVRLGELEKHSNGPLWKALFWVGNLPWKFWVVSIPTTVFLILWFLFQNATPEKVCGIVPEEIAAWIERCAPIAKLGETQ